MKKIIILSLLLLIIIFILACENYITRSFGGKQTIVLPENKKLIMATWKESDLWFLIKDMNENDKAETYQFFEESTFNVFEGTLTIIEQKNKEK